jgi:hypothetical protein
MEEVLNGYVTNPNPTLTLTTNHNSNPNPNPNPNRINKKNPKRNDFRKSIGRFAGWKIVLTGWNCQKSTEFVYSPLWSKRIKVFSTHANETSKFLLQFSGSYIFYNPDSPI